MEEYLFKYSLGRKYFLNNFLKSIQKRIWNKMQFTLLKRKDYILQLKTLLDSIIKESSFATL